MQPALLIRLRPLGPWRYGPGDGGSDRVDTLYRSDRLFSAVTIAMRQLGFLEDWIGATVRAPQPLVALSSLFPFQGETLFATPPATLWPPPSAQVTAPSQVFLAKVRWKAAHFIPLTMIDSLVTGQNVLADQWIPDPESGCLLRRDRPSSSPLRVSARRGAAVDRLDRGVHSVSSLSCVEFEPGAGLWTLARYQDSAAQTAWNERLEAAFRLLADTGFGGRRSSGWGQTEAPEFVRGDWPNLLLPKLGRIARSGTSHSNGTNGGSLFWLLSLFSPASTDEINWDGGQYEVTTRAGRVESGAASGLPKKTARMIAEGSVLSAKAEPVGMALDVAPERFEHPVYRSGLALALALPVIEAGARDQEKAEARPAEEPASAEAFIERPCDEDESESEVVEAPTISEDASPEAAHVPGEQESTSSEPVSFPEGTDLPPEEIAPKDTDYAI